MKKMHALVFYISLYVEDDNWLMFLLQFDWNLSAFAIFVSLHLHY